ncbi:hypothetical protein HELRODRAFT_177625 [Helobdella robusta]|uniref:Uncharacterized protein n=1 Tax=Helobdella robusta TaxID=6412 RepID=T1FBY3_HELRO|nr:hypothetical protein HELRODRAFT_177625 [Helobdella robusta]ESN97954.1 hypothetical protein HELRODRAFT_177625 [Helobdella robusta]
MSRTYEDFIKTRHQVFRKSAKIEFNQIRTYEDFIKTRHQVFRKSTKIRKIGIGLIMKNVFFVVALIQKFLKPDILVSTKGSWEHVRERPFLTKIITGKPFCSVQLSIIRLTLKLKYLLSLLKTSFFINLI